MGGVCCVGEEKEVEKTWLTWVEGIELNEKGETFHQGDDVCFTGESHVALMGEIECGRVRIAEEAEVTLIPYAGDLVLRELQLEGTLIFTAPWRGYHWTMTAGEHGLLVLDFGTFDLGLESSLPGPYDGALELRSGRVRYYGSRATGASNFSMLRVTEEGQFYLCAGSEYEGDVRAAGSGWIQQRERGGEGAIRFGGMGDEASVLRGKLTLEGDLSVLVCEKEEEGKIEGELDAAGYAMEKLGKGTLWIMGKKWRGLREIVVGEGRLVLEGNVDSGSTYQGSGEVCVTGGGVLELRGEWCGLSELQLAEEVRLHVQQGEMQTDVLLGYGNLAAPDGQIAIGELRDFSGEISAQLIQFHLVAQGEGYDATVHGQVVSDSFVKTGGGALRLDFLRVSGELWMKYSGIFELGKLVLEDGTLLRYGDGDSFVRVRGELISGEQLATPKVRVVVDSREFSEWQLQRGVMLGVGAGLAKNLVVSGLKDYRLVDQNGELWLYAEPTMQTAQWDSNWGERALLHQPGTRLPEILLAAGEELAMRETSLPCCSEDGTSTRARFCGTLEGKGAAVYGGCMFIDDAELGKSRDSWIDAAQGYFIRLVGGNACGGEYHGKTHLLLRSGAVRRMVGGNDSLEGSTRFDGECYLSVYNGALVEDVLCGGSVCGDGCSFEGQTHNFVYALLGKDTIVSGGNFYEQTGRGTFEGTSSVVLDLKEQIGEFAAIVTGGDYSAATGEEVKLIGTTQIIVHADKAVHFKGIFIGGSYSVKGQGITTSGQTMVQIDGGIFDQKVVGGSATLDGAHIGGSADSILLLRGGTYHESVVGGCYAEGKRSVGVQLGDVLVMMEEGVVLQDLVGGSMMQGGGEVQQGNISLLLRGGEIAGDVYASGMGNASFSTQNVMVSVGKNVQFSKEGAILSGGVCWEKTLVSDNTVLAESHGERRLVFGQSGEYENMCGVAVYDFDVLEIAPGAHVNLGGLVTDSVLLRGGGELTLHANSDSVHVDELEVGEGTRLNIDINATNEASVDAQLYVSKGGILGVDFLHEEKTENVQLNTRAITLRRGGTLELQLYFTRAMMRGGKEEVKGVLGEGQLVVEEGGLLSMRLAGVEDDLPLTGGHVVELVLAEHAQGMPELDDFTRGWLAEYFGDTACVEIVDGQLLLSGESVSEQTAHFYRDATCTPNGRAGAELLDSMMSVVDPQNTAPRSDRARLLQAQEQLISSGRISESDRLSAAAAGASLAALQAAFTTELRRALQSVADMVLCDDGCVEKDRTMIWTVQGVGGTHRLTESNNNSGYSMSSLGGMLTMQRCLSDGAQFGIQLSASGGKWHARAADDARADCEAYSLGAYYRIRHGGLLHAFAGQCAMTQACVNRDLFFAGGAYKTTGRTEGGGFSALYMLAWDSSRPDSSVKFRPLLQISCTYGFLNGYRERGSDAALEVGRQRQQTVSVGVGATLVGVSSQVLSRRCEWDVKILLSAEEGELANKVHTAMRHGGHHRATLRGCHPGCIAGELAVSLAVPLNRFTAVVAQAVVGLRRRSSGASASLGYRFSF